MYAGLGRSALVYSLACKTVRKLTLFLALVVNFLSCGEIRQYNPKFHVRPHSIWHNFVLHYPGVGDLPYVVVIHISEAQMKKVLAVASVLLGSMAASAATITINCSQVFSAVGPGSATSSCAGFGSIPGTITGLSGNYVFDFTFNPDATPPEPSVTFAVDVPSADSLDVSGIVVNQGNRPVSHPEAGIVSDVALLLAPFNVSVSWDATAPPVTGVTADLSFTVAYDEAVIPEPSTFALFSAGFVGFIAMMRRRTRA